MATAAPTLSPAIVVAVSTFVFVIVVVAVRPFEEAVTLILKDPAVLLAFIPVTATRPV
jgi:hypothetical protein